MTEMAVGGSWQGDVVEFLTVDDDGLFSGRALGALRETRRVGGRGPGPGAQTAMAKVSRPPTKVPQDRNPCTNQ